MRRFTTYSPAGPGVLLLSATITDGPRRIRGISEIHLGEHGAVNMGPYFEHGLDELTFFSYEKACLAIYIAGVCVCHIGKGI